MPAGIAARFIVEVADESMNKLLQILPIFLVLAGVALVSQEPAYAYADPGTGLLAVQAVGSALIATGWYLRRKIASFLHLGGGNKASSEQDDSPEQVKGPTQQ